MHMTSRREVQSSGGIDTCEPKRSTKTTVLVNPTVRKSGKPPKCIFLAMKHGKRKATTNAGAEAKCKEKDKTLYVQAVKALKAKESLSTTL